MATPEYFSRSSVNLSVMQTKLVVIVGVGMVGSQIAAELANCGVGRLRFIDHDALELVNLARHALNHDYLGWNKAEAMAVYLAQEVDGLETEAIARKIDASVTDEVLDQWLQDADLIIAATDDRRAQRRIGQRALALEEGTPSIFPALYVEGGGEIIVQADHQLPCFSCWDEFRPDDAPLRGVAASNFLALPVIYTAVRLTIGILDQFSEERNLMNAGRGSPPYLVFGLNHLGTLNRGFSTRRLTCPACRGGRDANIPRTGAVTRSTPRTATSRRLIWGAVGAALLLLIIIIASSGPSHQVSPREAAVAPPEPSLPSTASTTFTAKPKAEIAASVVHTAIGGGESEGPPLARITLMPVARGFTISIAETITYTREGIDYEGVKPDAGAGKFCLSVQTPPENGYEGSKYDEWPLEGQAHWISPTTLQGNVVFAAVLPGVYEVWCDVSEHPRIAAVRTPYLGLSEGRGFPGNAMVIYEEHEALTNTVLVFGAIGEHGLGDAAPRGSCASAETGSTPRKHSLAPASYAIIQHSRGHDASFAVGTMTLDVPSSQLQGQGFLFDCEHSDTYAPLG